MVNILTQNDIALALIDFFKVAVPSLTTSPGSVASDLFIDAPSSQLALLYTNLSQISSLQSLRVVAGSDLDKLAQNFGATRKQPTQSSGTALLTFSSIPAAVAINVGNILTAYTGATFSVVNGITVDPSQLNTYRATAIKYQNNLSFLNITDQYAVEVSVQATTSGSSGNIGAYTISSTTIPGVSNVTNVFPFSNGTDQETDAAFRNRVLAIFSGANVGTALGYQNAALAVPSVSSAIVIGPGNPLMTRDGTIVHQNTDGSYTIVSEGTGGKVDIQILGSVFSSHTDSYVYNDLSNTNNPTNAKNNFILGQIPGEGSLTIPEKRVQDIANSNLPAQPVQSILQVSGSSSGSNFIPMTTDAYGRISGNYELIKDTGSYAGSPWAQDAIAWTSNQINYTENKIKSLFNGQDATSFTGVINIPSAQQNISITNENSNVSSSDHSMITLLHIPSTNVTRVFNTNTGERYTIISQNTNSNSILNTTGVIQISGNTLPALTDILQVDYTWVTSYDPYSDYDGKLINDNPRTNGDSVDWSIANAIRNERILFSLNSTNTLYNGIAKHPVSYVISADIFSSTNGVVSQSTVANFLTRKAIVLIDFPVSMNAITSIKLTNTNTELYNTAQDDGFIINTKVVFETEIAYNIIIVLPTDTYATLGQDVVIEYNDNDTFNIVNSTGSFLSTQITIPVANIPNQPTSIFLDTTYITSVQNVLTTGITNFPLSRSGNGFYSNTNTGSPNTIQSNTIKSENQTIQVNGSSQLYITLSISSNSFIFDGYDVVSVIDLNSGNEIWNNDYSGTVSISSNTNYQLIFTGYNSPAVGDNVLVLYYADDNTNTQPFTFYNRIFNKSFQTAQINSQGNFYIPIDNFIVESSLSFNIIDTTTGLSIGSASDGYIFSVSSNNLTTSFSSLSFDFATITDLDGKILEIHKPVNRNNAGQYNIFSYNATTNALSIGVVVDNVQENQVSVIRIKDGKDQWNSLGTFNATTNTITLAPGSLILAGDEVIVLLFTNKILHQAPTKLSITVADQNQNTGKVIVIGTTITQVASVVFSAIENGLTQDLTSVLVAALGQNPGYQLPSNIAISRIVSLAQVSTTTNNIVLSTLQTYDVLGSQVSNNVYYPNEMILNSSLSNTEFILPPTTNNLTNAPSIGDQLQITFYYTTTANNESVYFTRNGTLYTNNKFAQVDQIYIASGFNTSQSAKFTFAYFTQPATGSSYSITYNYIAPKPNERISINYNYNQLITNVTFAIENTRPITADVLVKAAQELLVDTTVNIVVSSSFSGSSNIVLQNVQSAIINTINTETLGAILNQSNIIVAAQAVSGVERVRIIAFNLDGQTGQVLTLQAQQNQYFVANTITVNQESI